MYTYIYLIAGVLVDVCGQVNLPRDMQRAGYISAPLSERKGVKWDGRNAGSKNPTETGGHAVKYYLQILIALHVRARSPPLKKSVGAGFKDQSKTWRTYVLGSENEHRCCLSSKPMPCFLTTERSV